VGTAPVKITETALLNLGSNVNSQQFADELDEIGVWSRSLTAQEIWDIYVLQSGEYIGTTGLTDTLTFTADTKGTFTTQVDISYATGDLYTQLADAVVPSGGIIPFSGAGSWSGPGFSGGGADLFSGGRLTARPLIGKKK
jgi:hypothetical protein